MAELAILKNTQELDRLEGIIKKNLQSFYEVGCALIKIRNSCLYRDVLGYETFQQYCKDRWDMSMRHAERLMISSGVVDITRPIGRVPENESQVRPLSKLEPEQQKEVWQKAVETAPEGKITAAHVTKVVSNLLQNERKIKIKKIQKAINEIKVHPDFEKAYQNFYREVQNAKLENWKNTSKDEALKLVNYIIDLITI